MTRLTIYGLATLMLIPMAFTGCAKSISEQRDEGISYFDTNHFDQAKEVFTRVVDRKPDPESYYYLGRIYHIEGQFSKAIVNYQNCLAIDPSDAAARMWLERALQEYPPGKRLLFIPMPGNLPSQPS